MSDISIVVKKVSELIPYEKNPRKNDQAVPLVKKSIEEFGFKVPIVIDKDNVVVAGHTRLKAVKELGWVEVPCIVADDLNEEQIKAFRLADNKVSEKADWDFNILDEEIANIMDIDMREFGFDISTLESDEFGTDFSLPSGGKSNFEQITFTLASEQASYIKSMLEIVDTTLTETYGNENKNGNKLYEVFLQWESLKK